MTGTVVVPLDGSERAERALPIAASIAARTSSPLRLIHVHADGAASGPMDVAERYVRNQVDRMRGAAPIVVGDVMRGGVIDTLRHESTPMKTAWVVMTSGGEGGEVQGLGSVGTALIRHVEVPVLLCGPSMHAAGERGLPVEMRNIAIALDAFADTEPVLARTIRFARLHGARVTLISVVAEGGACSAMAARLDALADRLDAPDVPVCRRLVRSCDRAGSLVRAALEEDADALAIGRGFLERDPAAAAIVVAAKQPLLL